MAAFTPIVRGDSKFVNVSGVAGPEEKVLVTPGTYTATAQQEFAVIGQAQVVAVTIHTTAGGTQSTVPTIEYFDCASQTWVVLLTGAAIAAASGDVILAFGPHSTNVTNLQANTVLYGRMRVNMTHGNGNNHGYSISIASI